MQIPLDGLFQSFPVDRFDEVFERTGGKGIEGVIRISGNVDDGTVNIQLPQTAGQFQTGSGEVKHVTEKSISRW